MTENYPGWATAVAAEIAAEKRAAQRQATAQGPTVESMRLAMIRREIARRGAVDDAVTSILETLMIVDADGEIVERDTGKPMAAFIDDMAQTNPHYFKIETAPAENSIEQNGRVNMTELMQLWRTDPAKAQHIEGEAAPVGNPVERGGKVNMTELMNLWRTDPAKAEHVEYLAGIGKN